MQLRNHHLNYSTASGYFVWSCSDQKRVGGDKSIQSTLEWYVRESSSLVSRCQIEWQLAEQVLNEPSFTPLKLPLPDEVLGRSSGAMLKWVMNQQAHWAGGLPGRLASCPFLSQQQAVLFARAWAMWPQNPSLSGYYQALLEWLKPAREALGWVAIALAGAGQSGLARECVQLWLRWVTDDPYLPQLIPSMLKDPVLREFGIQALRRAVICHRNDWPQVESLCQLAFENGCAQEALMAAELLLPQVDGDDDGEQKWAIDAIRLAALARIDQQDAHQAAIHGYRQRWYQTERIFPYPLDLLRVMDHIEGDIMPLRRHLLSHCERSQRVVELAYRDVVEGKWQDTLPEWQALFEKNPQDRYFLFRLTEGLLEMSVDRAKMRDTYGKVIKEWETYAHLPAWRDKVRSVLFLLQADIPAYEAHLRQANLSNHWLITKAARRYVEMLLVQQKWDALLRFVNRKDIELLRYVCNSYQEFYLFKLLERLAEDEAEITDWNQWCHLWEELISLPLEERWLIAVLQRFATIHKQLSKKDLPTSFSTYLSDVERQLSRRGKALAERWLASKPITEREALRQRLKESVMLDDLLELLRNQN